MWIFQAARRVQARVLIPAALLCVSAAAFAAEQGAIRLVYESLATARQVPAVKEVSDVTVHARLA